MPRMIWALLLTLATHVVLFQVRMPEQEDARLAMTGTGQVTVRIAHTVQELAEVETPEPQSLPEVVAEIEPEPETKDAPEDSDAWEEEPVALSSPVLQPVSPKKSVTREVMEEETVSSPTRQPDMLEKTAVKEQSLNPGGVEPSSVGNDRPETQAIQKAEPLSEANRPPVYPVLARRRGWEGTVVLEVDVKSDGTVHTVQVQSSSSFTLLDQAAVEAVREWRFTPGSINNISIATKVMVPVHFVLQDKR